LDVLSKALLERRTTMCDKTNQQWFVIIPQKVYEKWRRGGVSDLRNPIIAREDECEKCLAGLPPNVIAVELKEFIQIGDKGLRQRMRQAVAV
jgi:hypothetical protein